LDAEKKKNGQVEKNHLHLVDTTELLQKCKTIVSKRTFRRNLLLRVDKMVIQRGLSVNPLEERERD
jgi:hypothetical protein